MHAPRARTLHLECMHAGITLMPKASLAANACTFAPIIVRPAPACTSIPASAGPHAMLVLLSIHRARTTVSRRQEASSIGMRITRSQYCVGLAPRKWIWSTNVLTTYPEPRRIISSERSVPKFAWWASQRNGVGDIQQ